jgi:hypothetical protein
VSWKVFLKETKALLLIILLYSRHLGILVDVLSEYVPFVNICETLSECAAHHLWRGIKSLVGAL